MNPPTNVAATDEVKYFYDSPTLPTGAPPNFVPGFPVGRLVAVRYGGSSAGDYYSYDPPGRVNTKFQQTGGINYKIGPVVYNLAGAVSSEYYPSGNLVNYNYDAAGRLNDYNGAPAFSGNLGGPSRTYAAGVSYNARSQMTVERFGTDTNIYHKQDFNIRGQLYNVRASTINGDWDRGKISLYYTNPPNGIWNAGDSGPDNNGNVLRTQS